MKLKPVRVQSVEEVDGDFEVVNFTCEPHPYYVAAGFLSHNCDTKYASRGENAQHWLRLEPSTVAQRVWEHTTHPTLVTFSGGNPALHDEVVEVMAILKAKDRRFTFALETQGSIAKPWFKSLDFLTISPKPPSSGNVTELRTVRECVVASQGSNFFRKQCAQVCVKFVVADRGDWVYATQIADGLLKAPNVPCSFCIQPCNTSPGDPDNGQLFDTMRQVIKWVLEEERYAFKVLPQLHVLLWGNKRGV